MRGIVAHPSRLRKQAGRLFYFSIPGGKAISSSSTESAPEITRVLLDSLRE